VIGMSKRSAEREWTMVRAWLRRELGTRDIAMSAERYAQVEGCSWLRRTCRKQIGAFLRSRCAGDPELPTELESC